MSEKKPARRLPRLLATAACLLLAACGGGGGGGGGTPLEGVFTAAGPVASVRYQTPSQDGLTDAGGAFLYLPGEAVTFSVGATMATAARTASRSTSTTHWVT